MFQTSGIFLSFHPLCAYLASLTVGSMAKIAQYPVGFKPTTSCSKGMCSTNLPQPLPNILVSQSKRKSLWAELTWRLLRQKIWQIEAHERICFYREQVIKIMSPIQSGFSECHDYLLPLFCALKNYSPSYKECGEPCHIILYMEALMCNIGDLSLSHSLSLAFLRK